MVVASAVLCALAVARHRYAAAHDLEEAEPDEDEAQRANLEKLDKVGKTLRAKSPFSHQEII